MEWPQRPSHTLPSIRILPHPPAKYAGRQLTHPPAKYAG